MSSMSPGKKKLLNGVRRMRGQAEATQQALEQGAPDSDATEQLIEIVPEVRRDHGLSRWGAGERMREGTCR
jgi:DNA-binding FrmR family transcriptional regulator